MKPTTENFEQRLVEQLQPVRFFALAQVLRHCLRLGLFTSLDRRPHTTQELATNHSLDAGRLGALLRYLENEQYVRDADAWQLTDKARQLLPIAPWYELLLDGYTTTFDQLGDALAAGSPYATRVDHRVGSGSCGISQHDALPLVESLLDRSDGPVDTVVDLGCGNGAFLLELLRRRPNLRGVGLEPSGEACQEAGKLAAAAGLSDRVTFHQAPARSALEVELAPAGAGVCFLTAFVLQEMLEQEGDAAVEALVGGVLAGLPEAQWIVIEVDHQPSGPAMAHPLAMAYYNEYFLLHAITAQRLEPRKYWDDLFTRAETTKIAEAGPPLEVDSTRLEFGVLLRGGSRF
ncbi:methyltransferase domain-containing protein [Jatrophihabitans lederbergiae]|uniref:Methyltransferase domain-containing protein n=1 Tax=Jatrophihabitans lederbergiae TaxID=3075547 RepID=A0ABU2JC65_9ACTN|nr:methyltransferase domain-containing protein [Jatrophihabitans sp. DSM 44399]MDT0262318.1 methyltransferase domain-containing protein [Jatrophihabitans sp. DSM 44399]